MFGISNWLAMRMRIWLLWFVILKHENKLRDVRVSLSIKPVLITIRQQSSGTFVRDSLFVILKHFAIRFTRNYKHHAMISHLNVFEVYFRIDNHNYHCHMLDCFQFDCESYELYTTATKDNQLHHLHCRIHWMTSSNMDFSEANS